MAAAPVLDGKFIVRDGAEPLAAWQQKHGPYLLGSTSEDMMPPILFTMAKSYCRTQADQGDPRGHCYFFDRRLPGDESGAWHSSDFWYWFGTLAHC